MNVGKEEVGIGGGILTFILLIFRGGRALEQTNGKIEAIGARVTALEGKDPVPAKLCGERREGCGRQVELQFDHGSQLFDAMGKMMDKLEKKSDDQHKEVMNILREMNKP